MLTKASSRLETNADVIFRTPNDLALAAFIARKGQGESTWQVRRRRYFKPRAMFADIPCAAVDHELSVAAVDSRRQDRPMARASSASVKHDSAHRSGRGAHGVLPCGVVYAPYC